MRYLIRAEGFSALGSKVPARTWEDFGVVSTAEGELPDVWTRLVKDPHTCQLKELKVSNCMFFVLQPGVSSEVSAGL